MRIAGFQFRAVIEADVKAVAREPICPPDNSVGRCIDWGARRRSKVDTIMTAALAQDRMIAHAETAGEPDAFNGHARGNGNGKARRGGARQGTVGHGRAGEAWLGVALLGVAWRGAAR